eukprot:scaffold8501_cov129-Isochrysis_galbana.AAC.2
MAMSTAMVTSSWRMIFLAFSPFSFLHLPRLLPEPLHVRLVDHERLEQVEHVFVADEHHDVGREASVAGPQELGAAGRAVGLGQVGG